MIGTFDGYLYSMSFMFTLVYVCVDVKLMLSISYSFRKSFAELFHFGEEG
jgi:hypothetical protein